MKTWCSIWKSTAHLAGLSVVSSARQSSEVPEVWAFTSQSTLTTSPSSVQYARGDSSGSRCLRSIWWLTQMRQYLSAPLVTSNASTSQLWRPIKTDTLAPAFHVQNLVAPFPQQEKLIWESMSRSIARRKSLFVLSVQRNSPRRRT